MCTDVDYTASACCGRVLYRSVTIFWSSCMYFTAYAEFSNDAMVWWCLRCVYLSAKLFKLQFCRNAVARCRRGACNYNVHVSMYVYYILYIQENSTRHFDFNTTFFFKLFIILYFENSTDDIKINEIAKCADQQIRHAN